MQYEKDYEVKKELELIIKSIKEINRQVIPYLEKLMISKISIFIFRWVNI